ncbi:MAG: hypothetical protein EBW87_01035 [Burkholderiaceae bacterium]|nr:hypothetical protein [Burkholderiaceae bacterium]
MSLNPTTYNITVAQGATYDATFTATDKTTNTPLNFTGYTGKMQVRQFKDTSEPAVLTLQSSSGITPLTNDGKVSIVATAAQTGSIPAGTYYYDIELTSGTYVIRLVEGKFVVTPQVTS